ncbi:MAG: hypothetical protein EOM64_09100, partial [Erysipelotrichia bacterium]|nr:hypothetical protein [Erysipelotrichia bacterium]
MKKTLMKAISVFLACILLNGCGTPAPASTAAASVPPSAAAEEESLTAQYTALPEDSVFYKADNESLMKMLQHGTGIVMIGFPECPWCQAYAPMLNEAAVSAGTKVMYFDIYGERKAQSDFYKQVAELINTWDPEIIQYDNDGNMMIYVPLVLFVSEGTLLGYDNETCTEDSDVIKPADYWTEEKKQALNEKLAGLSKTVSKLQAKKSSSG